LYGDLVFNYLLVVDLLRFHFRCRVFNSVFLCCWIGDRSSTIGIKVMTSKTTMTTKFEMEKFDGKSNFLLWKMREHRCSWRRAHTRLCLVLRRCHQRWRIISETTSTSAQKWRSYYIYQMRSSTTWWMRRQLLIFGVGWRAFIWWRVCQTSSSWTSSYTAFGWRKVRLFYNISILLIEF